MILDYLHRAEQYDGVWPNLMAGINFARSLLDAPLGNYDFQGGFVMIQEFDTVPLEEKLFEVHREYIDIHIVLEGEEILEYEDMANLSPSVPFFTTGDIGMMAGSGQTVRIKKGMFCLVFPHDGHKPGCCEKTPAKLKKMVVKIAR